MVVLIFHFRGNHGKPVPDWLKNILFIKQTKSSNSFQKNNKNHALNTNFLHMNDFNSFTKVTSLHDSDQSLDNQNIEAILKLIKHSCNLIKKRDQDNKARQYMITEWREVARRLDRVLFVIFTIVALLMSFMLFRKIFLNEVKISQVCDCNKN